MSNNEVPRGAAKVDADMRRVVAEQSLSFVATVNADGTPNLSPKGSIRVWDDEHLLFADVRSPVTVRNLERNPAPEINVVDPITRKGYRFRGRAEILRAGDEFERAFAFLRATGSTSPIVSIVVIRVERAAAVISPSYDSGASESEVAATWIERVRARLTGGRQ